jgi:hypothetical protein
MNVNTRRRYRHGLDPERVARETDLDTGPPLADANLRPLGQQVFFIAHHRPLFR